MSNQVSVPTDPRDIALRDEFRDYIELIRDDIARITGGLPDKTSDEAKDLRWLIKDLEKTRKELNYLEARIAHEADADPTEIFDFDAVKSTVGGRLDRLRQSFGAGTVSE